MILLVILVAVLVGLAIGKLAGFMGAEFVICPLVLLARGVAIVLGEASPVNARAAGGGLSLPSPRNRALRPGKPLSLPRYRAISSKR